MDSFWSLPSFWVSILISCLLSIGVSAFIQLNTDENKIKNKALVRDGILGAIFTTIVWVMSPETMDSISSSAQNLIGGAKEAAQTLGSTTYKLGEEVDIQVGPAKF
jgi:sensor histidine kinase regulating citrate/malate metabolism